MEYAYCGFHLQRNLIINLAIALSHNIVYTRISFSTAKN